MNIELRKATLNKKYKVINITAVGALALRIRDMGIVPGVEIKVVGKAPLKDPIIVKYRDTVLTLRNNEADSILVSSTLV